MGLPVHAGGDVVMDWLNKVHFGDCRDSMRAMITAGVRVNCIVTSPPYWGLRDYGHPGQLGLEKTPEEYVANMVAVFREVRRVLRDDGTLWLNLGDSYAKDKTKTLVGIPWRVAFALMSEGWLLISEIVWVKTKLAPAGGSRRPIRAHEQVFMLVKQASYYYDADAIREPLSPASVKRHNYQYTKIRQRADRLDGNRVAPLDENPKGRHKWSVWPVCPSGFKGAHFATFPPDLIEPCILAGCPVGGIVLDPFMGSGTTAQVAQALGRQWIGCELNEDYKPLQDERTAQMGMAL